MLHLLGRPVNVTAMKSYIHYEKLEVEDQASIMCQMPNGAIANLWCSFAANDPTTDPWSVLYKILGTNGGVCYSWNEAQYEDNRGPAWGCHVTRTALPGKWSTWSIAVSLVMRGPLSTLDDAIDALKIVQTAEHAVATGTGAVKVAY